MSAPTRARLRPGRALAFAVAVIAVPATVLASDFWVRPEIQPPYDTCRQYYDAAVKQFEEVIARPETSASSRAAHFVVVCRIVQSARLDMETAQCQGGAPYQGLLNIQNATRKSAKDFTSQTGVSAYCQ